MNCVACFIDNPSELKLFKRERNSSCVNKREQKKMFQIHSLIDDCTRDRGEKLIELKSSSQSCLLSIGMISSGS